MNESKKPEEMLADKILSMVLRDAKAAFPGYTDKQLLDFASLVIRKAIARLKSTPKQFFNHQTERKSDILK